MTVEVTYADYQALGLKGGEALFDASLPFSRAAVDFLIGPNEVTDEDAYKRAVCLGVDAWSDASDGELRIGQFSTGQSRTDPSRAASEAAYQVLAPTGMLFGGLA